MSDVTVSVPGAGADTTLDATPLQPLPAFTMLGGAGGACDGDSCSFEPFGRNDAVSA